MAKRNQDQEQNERTEALAKVRENRREKLERNLAFQEAPPPPVVRTVDEARTTPVNPEQDAAEKDARRQQLELEIERLEATIAALDEDEDVQGGQETTSKVEAV